MQRIEVLTRLLNDAARAYYSEGREIMSDKEYDALYDELATLEAETGIVLPDSPTRRVGYKVVSKLEKEAHEEKALSLDKTKDREALREWLGDKKGVLSWKMDGLTIVLTYDNGELVKAVTRGNGEIGEIVTHNARFFKGVPLRIRYEGRLVIRGEAVMSYAEFERVNNTLEPGEGKYKNPRNLAAGTVRQLDSRISASREINFVAFELVRSDNELASYRECFEFLKEQGFNVVEYELVEGGSLLEAIQRFEGSIPKNPYPTDGLVLAYNDLTFRSLGTTGKFPRNVKAFKWCDETAKTRLLDIEWSASRTGLINPVAVFEPVELEGTTVSRASVHNVSIVESMRFGAGDKIEVYKANMIIPQVFKNHTESGTLAIPGICPVCGGNTRIKENEGTKTLWCVNPRCPAKLVGRFEHFVQRDAMNIDGISTSTIESLIKIGVVKDVYDLYHISDHMDKITELDGFGEKSYKNLTQAVETSRQTTAARLLYSMGIPGIGRSVCKDICAVYEAEELPELTRDMLLQIDGVGDILAEEYVKWFKDPENTERFNRVRAEVTIERAKKAETSGITGKTFVITGSVNHFSNRDELKAFIEERGGKISGSVSAKTDYLINNYVSSGSSKNKKAKELGVQIISEETFLAMV